LRWGSRIAPHLARFAFFASRTPLMKRQPAKRRGTATVELAVCMPLLFALTFGVIETSNAIFLQQSLHSAAYEAANVATAVGGKQNDATSRADAVLTAAKVKNWTVSISPTVNSATASGTTVVVTVSAPLSSNVPLFGFLGNRTLSATVTMCRL
jgi:Flp pilus assembly protein TadG